MFKSPQSGGMPESMEGSPKNHRENQPPPESCHYRYWERDSILTETATCSSSTFPRPEVTETLTLWENFGESPIKYTIGKVPQIV